MVAFGFASLPRPATLSPNLETSVGIFRVIGRVPRLWGCSPQNLLGTGSLVVSIGAGSRADAGLLWRSHASREAGLETNG